jgi:hypothetical protein
LKEFIMTRTGRIVAASATALLGIAVLAGCSASTSSTPDAPASEAAASAEAAPIGGDVLPPVIVEPTATTAEAKVGDTVVFNVDKLAGTTISTTTPDLVELTQGGEQDGAEFNPGAKALAAGTAIVTVTNPDSSMRDVTITISE